MAVLQKKKIGVIFIISLFLISIINPILSYQVEAEETDETQTETSNPPSGLIGKILYFLGKFIGPTIAPNIKPFLVSVGADHPVIEIGYNEIVNLNIGMIDLETGDFENITEDIPVLYRKRLVDFDVIEYPKGISKDSWYITFEPNTVEADIGKQVKTNVSISLTSPPTLQNAIQNGIIKIRITDTWAMGNIWWPPDNFPGYETFPMKVLWLFSAIFLLRFGQYSGRLDVQTYDVDILVKVKPYHSVNLEAIPLASFKPDEIVSIPLSIQNLGNYNDTYSFRIESEHKGIVVSDPVSITLAPGEKKDTYLGVAVPISALDYGTLHTIKIQAYSISNPNETIAEREVILETRGVFVSEMDILGGSFILLIVVIVLIFIFLKIRKPKRPVKTKEKQIPEKKPEKPKEKPKTKEIKPEKPQPVKEKKKEKPTISKTEPKNLEKEQKIQKIIQEQDKQRKKYRFFNSGEEKL